MENQISQKPKRKYWFIFALLFGLLFFLITSIYLFGRQTTDYIQPPPYQVITPTKPVGKVSFAGTVKTGAELEEVKNYCPNGLYLVADEGTYLVNQTSVLQLRLPVRQAGLPVRQAGLPNQPDGTKMFSDQKYVGKRVKVIGKYPVQGIFCEALICECEDYILVEQVLLLASLIQ